MLKKTLFTSMEGMQITTVSSWLKSVAEESYLGKIPMTVVSNGLNSEVFKPTEGDIREKYGLQDKQMLLGVASGFGERKGLYDYINLSKRLPPQYKIVLVGVTVSDKKELPDSIIAVDRTNGSEELAAFYTCADVLLSLSYEETFGLTIVEAMACGTPAIVYDNTAQPELITPETGRVVSTGDLDALEKAICEVCGKEKTAYAEVCRNHAVQYDETLSYQKYLEVYKSVINRTK
jgi:glycosyltransferase involved in cell wall biosynthesis